MEKTCFNTAIIYFFEKLIFKKKVMLYPNNQKIFINL